MATWLPHASGFSGYASRFCDPALGFALGWTYWCKYIITTPNQLTASALIIQFWDGEKKVNPGVWIAIFLLIIMGVNYFGIRFFGELEFWLSSIKVVVIVGLILLSFLLAVGAGPGPATGFKFYKNPGAFAPYDGVKGAGPAKFVGFWSSFVNAVFAYLGTELIGVTVGEAQNPRRTIPKAIKLTFYRILFFYVLSVFFLGMLVPYNDKSLKAATKLQASAKASPFVLAIELAGIKVLPHILNGCILLFTFSASNSDLYIASRTLFGLAERGHAPKIFRWTDKRGVPVPALAVSALFCCSAFMNAAEDSSTVFGYFGKFSDSISWPFANLIYSQPYHHLRSSLLDLAARDPHLLRARAQGPGHHRRPDAVCRSFRRARIHHRPLLLRLDRHHQELQRLHPLAQELRRL
jgi:amino acid transporter